MLGLAADLAGRRMGAPRVSLLLLLGFIIGPPALNLLPPLTADLFSHRNRHRNDHGGVPVGQAMSPARLAEHGRAIILVSVAVVTVTALVVLAGLVLMGVDPVAALLFAGLATATDPVATVDVIKELRAKGPFCDLLEGVVAMDDGVGLLAFSLPLAVAEVIVGTGGAGAALLHGAWEILGAVLIGATLLPQAGIALGMALYAGERLPQVKEVLLTVIVGSTVVFEILGPVVTRIGVSAIGEARKVS